VWALDLLGIDPNTGEYGMTETNPSYRVLGCFESGEKLVIHDKNDNDVRDCGERVMIQTPDDEYIKNPQKVWRFMQDQGISQRLRVRDRISDYVQSLLSQVSCPDETAVKTPSLSELKDKVEEILQAPKAEREAMALEFLKEFCTEENSDFIPRLIEGYPGLSGLLFPSPRFTPEDRETIFELLSSLPNPCEVE